MFTNMLYYTYVYPRTTNNPTIAQLDNFYQNTNSINAFIAALTFLHSIQLSYRNLQIPIQAVMQLWIIAS